jgi:hypothetical protein
MAASAAAGEDATVRRPPAIGSGLPRVHGSVVAIDFRAECDPHPEAHRVERIEVLLSLAHPGQSVACPAAIKSKYVGVLRWLAV